MPAKALWHDKGLLKLYNYQFPFFLENNYQHVCIICGVKCESYSTQLCTREKVIIILWDLEWCPLWLFTILQPTSLSADGLLWKETQKHFTQVLGWNQYLSKSCNESTRAYILGNGYNKPRLGSVHKSMKRTWTMFKYAQRLVKMNRRWVQMPIKVTQEM